MICNQKSEIIQTVNATDAISSRHDFNSCWEKCDGKQKYGGMLTKIFASWRFCLLLLENKMAASTETPSSPYMVEKHRRSLLPLAHDL